MPRDKPTPVVLKREDWPAADREAWDTLFVPGRLFEDEGACLGWSAGTRKIREQAYGQWLSFLRRTEPSVLAISPAVRLTQPRLEAYITEGQARLKPVSVFNLIHGLLILAIAFAPNADWSWLQRADTRLRRDLGSGDLKPAPALTALKLFRWSLGRMADVDADPTLDDRKRAIGFRQALMIGVLISCPVRRRAFLAMTVSNHIVEIEDGFQLHFSADDMKDDNPHRFWLPHQLVEPMRLYLDLYQPILLGDKQSNGLWINQYGKPLTPDGYARELPKVTERHLGVALRPHAFRHIAATSIAEADPEHVGIIRDVLGHATLDMAEKHYNRATANSACNKLQSVFRDIRRKAARMEDIKR